jgi:hypothetical protein
VREYRKKSKKRVKRKKMFSLDKNTHVIFQLNIIVKENGERSWIKSWRISKANSIHRRKECPTANIRIKREKTMTQKQIRMIK